MITAITVSVRPLSARHCDSQFMYESHVFSSSVSPRLPQKGLPRYRATIRSMCLVSIPHPGTELSEPWEFPSDGVRGMSSVFHNEPPSTIPAFPGVRCLLTPSFLPRPQDRARQRTKVKAEPKSLRDSPLPLTGKVHKTSTCPWLLLLLFSSERNSESHLTKETNDSKKR